MSLHRFAVGQSVEFAPGRLDATATLGTYTVVRLHPDEPGDREYRVKNAHDGHERVVRESRIPPYAARRARLAARGARMRAAIGRAAVLSFATPRRGRLPVPAVPIG